MSDGNLNDRLDDMFDYIIIHDRWAHRYRSIIADYANIELLAEMTDDTDPLAHGPTADAIRRAKLEKENQS